MEVPAPVLPGKVNSVAMDMLDLPMTPVTNSPLRLVDRGLCGWCMPSRGEENKYNTRAQVQKIIRPSFLVPSTTTFILLAATNQKGLLATIEQAPKEQNDSALSPASCIYFLSTPTTAGGKEISVLRHSPCGPSPSPTANCLTCLQARRIGNTSTAHPP